MTDCHQQRYVTLVGTPLSQSFAARMQNAGYQAAGVNAHYLYTEAGPEHLSEIMGGIRYMPSFMGAAITKPNKVAVMGLLDKVDPLCAKIGACNTVVKDDQGRLVGYNTDADGFWRSLVDAEFSVEGKTFFCFGAGGVGRPICAVLADKGARKIYVTDLFPECAQQLAQDLNAVFAPIVETVPFGAFDRVAECDGVINASGVGMGATQGESPLAREYFTAGTFYFDACYNPAKTQFLMYGEAAGGRILNGLGMSLYQGTKQFELWLGAPAPVEAMRNELLTILDEQKGTR